jgi:3'(2'), 5'-bisphosphate nucleotidase
LTAATSDHELAADLAREAGDLLLGMRAELDGPATEPKALGAAGDRASNALILARLAAERPHDAVLSEEAVDDPARLEAERVWIIDPLDGTREFTMAGRPDWAVHVALWRAGAGIVAAAVAQPVLGHVYSTGSSVEPYRQSRASGSDRLILVSDSRPPAFAGPVARQVGARVAPMGSAGAKAMAVLRGEADAYLHAGGQWEWDSAAPVGVVQAAGLHASRIDGSELRYNQPRPYLPDLLICTADLAEPILAALAGMDTVAGA